MHRRRTNYRKCDDRAGIECENNLSVRVTKKGKRRSEKGEAGGLDDQHNSSHMAGTADGSAMAVVAKPGALLKPMSKSV